MTLEQIEALSLEDVVAILLPRILDVSGIAPDENPFMIDLDESIDFYDRIIMHKSLVKPSVEAFNRELDQHKEELRVVEQARLDEVARVEDIMNRFSAISDIRATLIEAGLSITNPAKELARIIDEDDQVGLTALESAAASFDQKQTAITLRESRRAQGKAAREICLEVLDIIGGHNIENGTTGAALDSMTTTYADLLAALQNNRPMKAKSLILAVVPDGTLVTQAMKDDVLAAYLAAGL
jgi:hypothetical protein